MDWLTQLLGQLLGQPITQFGGPIGILVVLHRMGYIDLRAMISSAVGIDGSVREVNADNRDALQPVVTKLDLITSNHLEHVQASLNEMRGTQLQQCTKLDLMVDALQDIQRNGIRIRN